MLFIFFWYFFKKYNIIKIKQKLKLGENMDGDTNKKEFNKWLQTVN